MIDLRVTAVDEKTIQVTGIVPILAHCLFQLPEILRRRDVPGVHERLFQDPHPGDPQASADWHEIATPDLRHLFVTAEETVVRDLTTLTGSEVTFPAVHLQAWISALNQARLILGELHHVTEAAMERTDLDPANAEDSALLQIHLLGFLLQLLIEHVERPGIL